jgi:hypothetical protein
MKGTGSYTDNWNEIALAIKAAAGWCCVRCGHPNDRASGHILTVHHLDGDKSNNLWYNTPALCQRCHLRIQGKVIMSRGWLLPHSEWFKPYVAGYYAHELGLCEDRAFVETWADALIELGREV